MNLQLWKTQFHTSFPWSVTNRAHQLGTIYSLKGFFTEKYPMGGSSPPHPHFSSKKPAGTRKIPKTAAPGEEGPASLHPPCRQYSGSPLVHMLWFGGVSKIQVLQHPCCNWIWAWFLHVPWQFCCLVSKPGTFSLSSSCHLICPDYFNHSWLASQSLALSRVVLTHSVLSWFSFSLCDRSLIHLLWVLEHLSIVLNKRALEMSP